jgi:hypothetical protein
VQEVMEIFFGVRTMEGIGENLEWKKMIMENNS